MTATACVIYGARWLAWRYDTQRPDAASALLTLRAYNALPQVYGPWGQVPALFDEPWYKDYTDLVRIDAKRPNITRLPLVKQCRDGYTAYDGLVWASTPWASNQLRTQVTIFETAQQSQDWVDARLRERGAILLTEIP